MDDEPVPTTNARNAFATALRRKATDPDELLRFIAERLGRSLSGAVRVKRRGLLGKGAVYGVRVRLLGEEFGLARGPGSTLVATLGQVSGDGAVRDDPVDLDWWIDRFATALAALAEPG